MMAVPLTVETPLSKGGVAGKGCDLAPVQVL